SRRLAMRATDRYAALNRRARHDYLIEATLESGLVLHGTEVKVLRQGGASIAEAYADEAGGELYLVNANIPEYKASAHFNHQPARRSAISPITASNIAGVSLPVLVLSREQW